MVRELDYKAVLQEQIRELQKLQDENMEYPHSPSNKAATAISIAEQIRKLCIEAASLPL